MDRTTRTREQTGLSPLQKWTLFVSCLSIALVVGSMAALYTALPDIALETGATQRQLTWIVDAYTLALACLVLPAGALGDRYGRRLSLVVGLAIVTAASTVPLVFADPEWLIGARAAAGVGAAFVMPSTLSIMTGSFPESERGRAVGIWAGLAGSGAVLGILGSGALIQIWSWTSIFLGLAIVSAVLFVLVLTIPESQDADHPPMDPIGAVLSAVAVAAIVVAVIEGPERGWLDPLVLSVLVFGIACAAVFVVVQLRTEHPLLQVRLFGRRGFGSGTASITVQFLVSFGLFLVLVQFLQLILGYSPIRSAFAMAPMIGPIAIISVFAPWMADRVGLRLMTVSGLAVLSMGLYLVSRVDADTGYVGIMLPLVVASIGMGLASAPATTAIVTDTPVEKHGVAAAVNDAAREVGAAIGIAIAGSVIAAGYAHRIQPALASVPPDARGPISDSLASALEVAERSGPAGVELAHAANAAFMHGAAQASLALAAISLVGAVALGVWAPGRTTARTNRDAQAELASAGVR